MPITEHSGPRFRRFEATWGRVGPSYQGDPSSHAQAFPGERPNGEAIQAAADPAGHGRGIVKASVLEEMPADPVPAPEQDGRVFEDVDQGDFERVQGPDRV